MPHGPAVLIAAILLSLPAPAPKPVRAAPLFSITDSGRTFLYRANPGDNPTTVAEMFGISANEFPAFLAENEITDPTRVGAGFVYRVPNGPARALGVQVASVSVDNARLGTELGDATKRAEELNRRADEEHAAMVRAEERLARLAWAESFWPVALVVAAALVIALATAIGIAVAAVRKHQQADRYARTLAADLESKRGAWLIERQSQARRELELETRLRDLEARPGPRAVSSGSG